MPDISAQTPQTVTAPSLQSIAASQSSGEGAGLAFPHPQAPTDGSPPPSAASPGPRTGGGPNTAANLPGGQQSPDPSPPATQDGNNQSSGQIVSKFESIGFEVPPGMTDDEFVEAVARQIDESVRIQESLKSGQQASGSASPPPAEQQAHSPQEEGSGAPAGAPSPNSGTGSAPPKLSAEAEVLAKQGLIRKGENGWEATNPAFQQFADEYNKVEAYRQAMAIRLIDDPAGFIREHVEVPEPKTVEELKKEIDELKKTIAAQAAIDQEKQFESWVEKNASILFADDSRKTLTPYGQVYDKFFAQIKSLNPQLGTQDIHAKTLSMMEAAGVKPSAQSEAGQNGHPQNGSQRSFMEAASQATPRMPQNNLTEFSKPAQQPSGTMIPGRRGRPSLGEIANALKNGQIS